MASTTMPATPCSRAIGACARHWNSAGHRVPTVMMAISDSRRSIDVPTRASRRARTAATQRHAP
jgi:hypothetical protein